MPYEQAARIGKGVSSPKQSELPGLAAQGKKTVKRLSAKLLEQALQ